LNNDLIVLDQAQTKYQLKLKEALHIMQWEKPSLNKQSSLVITQLFQTKCEFRTEYSSVQQGRTEFNAVQSTW